MDDLWTEIEDETSRTPPVRCERTVLVWRRELRVLHRTLDDDEALLVREVVHGETLAHLSAQLAGSTGLQPEQRMVELLGRWLDAAILAA